MARCLILQGLHQKDAKTEIDFEKHRISMRNRNMPDSSYYEDEVKSVIADRHPPL
jgi:hypothetical protein